MGVIPSCCSRNQSYPKKPITRCQTKAEGRRERRREVIARWDLVELEITINILVVVVWPDPNITTKHGSTDGILDISESTEWDITIHSKTDYGVPPLIAISSGDWFHPKWEHKPLIQIKWRDLLLWSMSWRQVTRKWLETVKCHHIHSWSALVIFRKRLRRK